MNDNNGIDSSARLKLLTLSAAVAIGFLLTGISGAFAQGSASNAVATGGVGGKMRLNIFGTLGFGGEAAGETVFFDDDDELEDFDFDDRDLDTTNGIGAQFDYALHRYFLLGGRLSFNFVDIEDLYDDDTDRSLLVNIDVVPKGRLPVAGTPIEFYLAMPVGPTLNFPNNDLKDEYPGDTDLGTGASWNLSLHAGLHYWFNSTIGLFVEQGWYHQAFQFSGETEAIGQTIDFVTSGSFNQFSVNIGLTIGL